MRDPHQSLRYMHRWEFSSMELAPPDSQWTLFPPLITTLPLYVWTTMQVWPSLDVKYWSHVKVSFIVHSQYTSSRISHTLPKTTCQHVCRIFQTWFAASEIELRDSSRSLHISPGICRRASTITDILFDFKRWPKIF